MRKGYPARVYLIWLTALTVWMAGGCAPVDRWRVFEPQYDRYDGQEASYPLGAADRFRPDIPEAEAVEMPLPGEALSLSVEDAAMLTLENNSDLQVQQLNPIITGAFEQIERGVYDPEVFAEIEYAEEKASETSRATGEQFSVEASDAAAVAGIRQELPTGTRLEAAVEHERDQSNRAPDQSTARIGLSITQSLLRGFGPAVNLVSVRQAEFDTLASIYELRGFTETLVADSEIAYWHYVLALQEISIYESSLAIAEQQLDEVEQQIEVGILPETEAAAARTEVARREQALIDARSLMEERRLRLLHLINFGGTGQLDRKIKATSNPVAVPEPLTDQAQRLELADMSRPDLGEARLRKMQGRLETIATRNGLLPRLDLFIELGRTGYAERFSSAFRELNGNTYDINAGVRLSHYLGNRAAEARHEAAWANHRQSAEAVDNLRQLVELDVRLAINEVERTRQLISASRATRRLEEQTLQAEKERFKVGASTALLVAQAQRDLLVSQIAEVRAIINYRTSLVKLYLAEGSLLQRRGITIGDPEKSRYSEVNPLPMDNN